MITNEQIQDIMDATQGNTIVLFNTINGWFAKFSDQGDIFGTSKAIPTAFTRHAKGVDVERMIKSLNPDYTIYVIGG